MHTEIEGQNKLHQESPVPPLPSGLSSEDDEKNEFFRAMRSSGSSRQPHVVGHPRESQFVDGEGDLHEDQFQMSLSLPPVLKNSLERIYERLNWLSEQNRNLAEQVVRKANMDDLVQNMMLKADQTSTVQGMAKLENSLFQRLSAMEDTMRTDLSMMRTRQDDFFSTTIPRLTNDLNEIRSETQSFMQQVTSEQNKLHTQMKSVDQYSRDVSRSLLDQQRLFGNRMDKLWDMVNTFKTFAEAIRKEISVTKDSVSSMLNDHSAHVEIELRDANHRTLNKMDQLEQRVNGTLDANSKKMNTISGQIGQYSQQLQQFQEDIRKSIDSRLSRMSNETQDNVAVEVRFYIEQHFDELTRQARDSMTKILDRELAFIREKHRREMHDLENTQLERYQQVLDRVNYVEGQINVTQDIVKGGQAFEQRINALVSDMAQQVATLSQKNDRSQAAVRTYEQEFNRLTNRVERLEYLEIPKHVDERHTNTQHKNLDQGTMPEEHLIRAASMANDVQETGHDQLLQMSSNERSDTATSEPEQLAQSDQQLDNGFVSISENCAETEYLVPIPPKRPPEFQSRNASYRKLSLPDYSKAESLLQAQDKDVQLHLLFRDQRELERRLAQKVDKRDLAGLASRINRQIQTIVSFINNVENVTLTLPRPTQRARNSTRSSARSSDFENTESERFGIAQIPHPGIVPTLPIRKQRPHSATPRSHKSRPASALLTKVDRKQQQHQQILTQSEIEIHRRPPVITRFKSPPASHRAWNSAWKTLITPRQSTF